jgi:hypothetical protein
VRELNQSRTAWTVPSSMSIVRRPVPVFTSLISTS